MKIRGCDILTHRAWICAVILLLIIMGPILIAVDLTYLTDWIHSFHIGDFYTYLTFIGVISAWSVFGLVAVFMSAKLFNVYMIGLIIIVVIHFIVGFVHVMLLFTKYRPFLINSCLQRDPSRLFWWSLGFEDSEEMKQIYNHCSSQWQNFTTERIVSWFVYSVVSFVCLFFVIRYQRQWVTEHGQGLNQTDDWSDDDSSFNEKKARSASITYHQVEFPQGDTKTPQEDVISANMYQQRQRLFDEIAKRKRAKKNLSGRRRSLGSNPDSSRNSAIIVHPLDLAQDPESYHPPPMPTQAEEASWNRYHQGTEQEEAIDRQRRLEALSAERMEYEMYRSEGNIRTTESDDEIVTGGTSHRKRPKSSRWSSVYTNNNIYTPLSDMNQQEDQEDQEDQENQALMGPEN